MTRTRRQHLQACSYCMHSLLRSKKNVCTLWCRAEDPNLRPNGSFGMFLLAQSFIWKNWIICCLLFLTRSICKHAWSAVLEDDQLLETDGGDSAGVGVSTATSQREGPGFERVGQESLCEEFAKSSNVCVGFQHT